MKVLMRWIPVLASGVRGRGGSHLDDGDDDDNDLLALSFVALHFLFSDWWINLS